MGGQIGSNRNNFLYQVGLPFCISCSFHHLYLPLSSLRIASLRFALRFNAEFIAREFNIIEMKFLVQLTQQHDLFFLKHLVLCYWFLTLQPYGCSRLFLIILLSIFLHCLEIFIEYMQSLSIWLVNIFNSKFFKLMTQDDDSHSSIIDQLIQYAQ